MKSGSEPGCTDFLYLRSRMRKKLIIDARQLDVTLDRLCRQLIENHAPFTESVLVGLQPRGTQLAGSIRARLKKMMRKDVPMGVLDATFHRDDFRRRDTPARAHETRIDFPIENKRVILIDDVLFTGRTVRAAMDALLTFGRPAKVELMVLIDRAHTRDLPIAADYIGKTVHTLASQRVLVHLVEEDASQNRIWLTHHA